MNNLLSLPNELLLTVVNNVYRDDIENFAFSCKTIFEVSQNALAKHRLRKKHAQKSLRARRQDDRDSQDCMNFLPFPFLRQLLDDEDLAPYVISVHVHTYRPDWDPDADVDGEEEDNRKEYCWCCEDVCDHRQRQCQSISWPYRDRLIKALSNVAGYLDADDLAKDTERILSGDPGSTIGLILCLLPNLTTFSIDGFSYRDLSLTNFLQRVIGDTTQSARSSGVLCKLSELKVSQRGFDDLWDQDFEMYKTLSQLPSLRSFKGTRLCHNELYSDPFRNSATCALESIDLFDCDINWKLATSLFGKTECLRDFRLRQNSTYMENNYGCLTQPLIAWLERKALKNLKSLELVNFGALIIEEGNVSCHEIDSLRGFNEPKTLEIPAAMLSTGKIILRNSKTRGPGRPLALALPPSLERLTIAFSYSRS